MGVREAMTIRITTPTTATKRRNRQGTILPTSTTVTIMRRAGDGLNRELEIQCQPVNFGGYVTAIKNNSRGGIFANDGNLYINKTGFRWMD
ncbi:hypothetical protein KCP71_02155 [Salmonella enterica subsp. enterica]|nr:hypothetical protein KCP71_02155 [Salmonella enterica subsp. enterica]